MVATDDGPAITWHTYDNLGEATSTQVFDGSLAGPINASNPQPPADGLLRASSYTLYDDRGRAYRTVQYGVDQTTGAVSGNLTTNVFYDGRGNVVKTIEPGGLVTRTTFDGAERATDVTIGSATTDVTRTHTDYDDNGNTILVRTEELQPGGGYRTSYVANWYDEADRLTDTVNYGTAFSSRPAMPPSDSTDTALLTHYGYDEAGNVNEIIDPRGIKTKQQYDALGRMFRKIEAYVDGVASPNDDRITNYEYTELDQIKKITTYNARPGSSSADEQVTAYLYDSSMGAPGGTNLSNNVLRKIVYPDLSSEQFAYNQLNETIKKIERNGVTHDYTLDAVGRVTGDKASTLPNGIDAAVRELKFGYDALGRLTTAGSLNGGRSVVNQVERTYNGFGQLLTEVEDHNSAVDGDAQAVSYDYAMIDGASRLSTMTYPNGRIIDYEYNSGIDSALGRISFAVEDSNALESYNYLGLSQVIGLERPLTSSMATELTMTTTLDSLGRPVDQRWTQYLTGGTWDQEHVQYGYDRVGHRLFADNKIISSLSELYHASGAPSNTAYTPLGELTEFQRGTLNGAKNSIPSPINQSRVVFERDTQGNATKITRNGVDQSLAYDSANRVTTGGTSDAAGNTTSLGFNNYGFGVEGTYDAWGRLVKTNVTGRNVPQFATYAYDALGRQISLHEDVTINIFLSVSNQIVNNRQFYHDAAGNVIEEQISQDGSARAQYVWSPVTGQMILRDRATTEAGAINERLYAIYDPDGTITAVADTDGQVVERYIYDATGNVQALNDQGQILTFAFDSTGSSERDLTNYFTTPLADTTGQQQTGQVLGGSNVAWGYYWHGMQYEREGGLYWGQGGQAFNPRIDRAMQPKSNGSTGYRYTNDQLSQSWGGSFWNSLWSSGDYGAAGVVSNTDPYHIAAGARFVGIAALSVATVGLGTTLVGAGLGAGIGGVDSALGGGSFANGAVSGAEFGMGITAALGVWPAGAAWYAGMGLNAGLTSYGVYDSFSNGRDAQGYFRLATGAYFGLRQLGYDISFMPAPEQGTVTLNTRLLPFRIAKIRAQADATRQMLSEDMVLPVSERAFYSAPHANSKATLKEAWGYALVSRRTGEVLKYGETTQGFARYTQEYLRGIGARMQPMATGSKAEMHQWQHEMILNHEAAHGKRPSLNKSYY